MGKDIKKDNEKLPEALYTVDFEVIYSTDRDRNKLRKVWTEEERICPCCGNSLKFLRGSWVFLFVGISRFDTNTWEVTRDHSKSFNRVYCLECYMLSGMYVSAGKIIRDRIIEVNRILNRDGEGDEE